jgi:uncharacterized protein (TIRG00374 family)
MKGMAKKSILWLVAAILMGSLLYWGRHDLVRIKSLDPVMVAVCFGCTAGIAVTSALKWRLSLGMLGEAGATHFGSLLYYFMCGRAIGLVLPMDVSDFGVRMMSLKFKHAVSIGKASYSVYLDRTFDVVVAGLFLIPSVLFITGAVSANTGLILFAVAFGAGLICFTFLAGKSTRLLAFIFRVLFKAVCKIPWVGKRVEFDTENRLLEGGDFTSAAPSLYALSVVKFVFTVLRFVVIAAAVSMSLGFKDIVLFVPGAQFAALFALTPGGLGIADWSWSGLLYKIGADRHMIVPYLVSLRLVIALSIVVLAGLSRLLYRNPGREEGKGFAGRG